MGSGIGSVPFDRLVHAVSGLLQATMPDNFETATQAVPLSEVEQVWPRHQTTRRTVLPSARNDLDWRDELKRRKVRDGSKCAKLGTRRFC